MIKQATIFRTGLAGVSLDILERELSRREFTPCLSTQQQSIGWVKPGDNGTFVEVIGRWRILSACLETKRVPADEIKRQVDARAKAIESETGRPPGKKHLRELKDQVVLELLPKAFPKRKTINIVVSDDGLTVIGSTSGTALEAIITEIVSALAGVGVRPLLTNKSPASWMQSQLLFSDELTFGLGQSCELKSTDEDRATVRYSNHPLDIEEVRSHLESGKHVTKLELLHAGRTSFVLTDGLQLKGIEVTDSLEIEDGEKDGSFAGTAFLELGALWPAIIELISALGGETAEEPQAE